MTQIASAGGPAQRILQLIDLLEVKTPTGLARLANLPRTTVTSIIVRDSISPQTATLMSEALKVRREWLQFGTGPVFEEDLPSGAYSVDSSAVRRAMDVRPEQDFVEPMQDSSKFVFVRKAVSKISAGGGIIPDEEFEDDRYAFRIDWLKRFATSPTNVILMEVEGDSMSPTLQNGNIVLIDTGRRNFKPGKLFAIRHGDIIQIKRLDIASTGIFRIYSDNPLYGREDCAPDDLHIIGQLIWSARTWV